MKKSVKRTSTLTNTNITSLRKANDKPIQDTDYHRLLYVLADMFDCVAKGDDYYCILGTTKDKSAFSFTLVNNDDRESFYAESLSELCLKVAALI